MTVSSRKVLRTPELVHAIIGELQSDHGCLSHLARVSNIFHDISIKFLWAGGEDTTPTDTLHRLIKVLPDGLIGGRPWGSWMKRGIEESDWLRFQHYSIHCLCLSLEASRYSRNLLTYLGRRRERFFPRLRTLAITEDQPAEHSSVEWMLLTGPSLRGLEVRGPSWSQEWCGVSDDPDHRAAFRSFSEQLIPRVPHLTHLDITDFITPLSHAQVTKFCSIIFSLSKLQTFRLRSSNSLSSDILSTLAHPTISEITLNPVDMSPRFEGTTVRFPSLRRLSLAGEPEAMAACIRNIAHIHLLSEINLDISDTDHIHPLLPLLPIATNLTKLGLVIPEVVSWAALRPLLTCGSLCDLSIYAEAPIVGLHDGALEDLAISLPALETLYIVAIDREPDYEATVYGLIPLATHCPHLRELTLQVTTRVTIEEHEMPVVEGTNDDFHSLTLVKPEINPSGDTASFLGPRRTARFLASLWPSLGPSGMQLDWGDPGFKSDIDHELEEPCYVEVWDEMLAFMGDLEWSRNLYRGSVDDLERQITSLRETAARLQKQLEDRGESHTGFYSQI